MMRITLKGEVRITQYVCVGANRYFPTGNCQLLQIVSLYAMALKLLSHFVGFVS